MEKITKMENPPRETLKRILIVFIGNVIGIYLISFIGLGVTIDRFDDIILFVLFLGFVNAVLWPILTKILMPFLVLTFGIGTLLLNGLLLHIFGPFFGITVNGIAVILAPLAMALVTTILSALLTIEDDGTYYRFVLRDAKQKRKDNIRFMS